jgi:PII-like signaling protein
MGEADKWHDAPLYDAIVKKLLMMDIAGATVYRGILGYGAKGHQHKATFFHPTRDLPVMVSVIDTAEKIAAAAEVIEGCSKMADRDLRRRDCPAGSQPK